ncbi:PREDICTED: uncharacterized protein LOC109584871 [Amphimedon queenslandica]|uniref:Uncharacterized protein n=1 Tax=Amphimedon queenslandica TaxID=400682 RepID=A0AAN0JH91_AMPQE|nr:PREDICTED: uncharacterized protein LOC109584871 [Amphimedon queenslandica]|eukprot:XP_019856329.1 PREDICTED: uncharacterized protein LOC109584871 [Amphimedon queenslandica]
MATVNVTKDINSTSLQCRNQIIYTGSVNEEVDFSVEDTTPVTQIFLEATDGTPNITFFVTWPTATCAKVYNGTVEKDGKLRQHWSGQSTFFTFDVKKSDINDGGMYTIAVHSVGYDGMSVGVPASRNISIHTPEFTVSPVIDCININLSLIIEEEEDASVSHLDVVSCVISLATVTRLYNNTRSCIGRKIDFNITIGGSYNYNVTLTNLFGSSSMLNVADTNICIETTASTQPTATTIVSASADNAAYIATSVTFGFLFGSLLVFIVFERLRCFCPAASFWSIVFCDCLAKVTKRLPFDGEEMLEEKEADVFSDL